MGESSTPESTKPVLDVGIITALTVLANKVLPPSQHEAATTTIPVIGGLIAWGIRSLRKHRAYMKLVELETKWLNEAIAERDKPGLTRKRYQELDADITRRKQALEELQRENTKIQ